MLQLFDNLQPPIYKAPICVDVIRFNKNYNIKLHQRYFTSLRLPGKWQIGQYYDVHLQDKHFTYAQLVDIKLVTLDTLPEYTAMLDTGLSLGETKQLLIDIYTMPALDQHGVAVLMFDNQWFHL
jgi:hypothetical protein